MEIVIIVFFSIGNECQSICTCNPLNGNDNAAAVGEGIEMVTTNDDDDHVVIRDLSFNLIVMVMIMMMIDNDWWW